MTAVASISTSVPPLAVEEAHVWHARAGDGRALAERLLSDDELARAARFRHAEDRERWLGAHAVLRDLLARYAIARPREPLLVGRYGKPQPADPRAARFNLSHSGDDVLVAIARQEVGVDVEQEPRGDVVALARTGLGELTARRLALLPEHSRVELFLRLWTRHEASIKATGAGLGGPPSASVASRTIDIGPGRAAAVAATELRQIRRLAWRL